MENEALLTPSAVARIIERSEHTVKHYAVTGRLPAIKTTTGRRLFRQCDVEQFLIERRVAAQAEGGE